MHTSLLFSPHCWWCPFSHSWFPPSLLPQNIGMKWQQDASLTQTCVYSTFQKISLISLPHELYSFGSPLMKKDIVQGVLWWFPPSKTMILVDAAKEGSPFCPCLFQVHAFEWLYNCHSCNPVLVHKQCHSIHKIKQAVHNNISHSQHAETRSHLHWLMHLECEGVFHQIL